MTRPANDPTIPRPDPAPVLAALVTAIAPAADAPDAVHDAYAAYQTALVAQHQAMLDARHGPQRGDEAKRRAGLHIDAIFAVEVAYGVYQKALYDAKPPGDPIPGLVL